MTALSIIKYLGHGSGNLRENILYCPAKTLLDTSISHHSTFLTSNSSAGSTARMLYLVGLGLADETDITVKGLEVAKRASRVYLEAYTSILLVDKEKLVSCAP